MSEQIGRLCNFLLRVLRGFIRNQGLLLTGAVAFYTLLSIMPLSILALIVLTHFIEEQQLIHTLSTYLEMVIPGYAANLTEQVRVFLEYRKVVSAVGAFVMLFFSSTAFSMLENAMSIIFFQRVVTKRRNFFISAVIPYVYILAMGMGIVLVSFVVGAIETLESRHLTILGWSLNLGGTTGVALYGYGDNWRGGDAHLNISGDARGAGKVSSRTHWRVDRGGVMGDHPSGADLVLHGRIHGQCHLRLHRHDGGGPSQHSGSCGNPAFGCPGYC